VEPAVAPTDRTRIRRLPEKAVEDRAVMHAILDAAIVAHVGITVDTQPYVMPVGHARDGDRLLLHGSTGSRLFRTVVDGAPLCITVTLLDGLLVARSLFESSMHYRSVVVLGRGTALHGDAKSAALDVLADALLPGRRADARPPTRRELAATSVVAVPLEEWSVKVSAGEPEVVEEDEGWAPWTGLVPLRLTPGTPKTCEGNDPPAYVTTWQR
jgi:nitroimidazol reductase NimA-like FMN-containing flavoprotein (pyridoxamine 5'-phosphate oxidase superfamily)